MAASNRKMQRREPVGVERVGVSRVRRGVGVDWVEGLEEVGDGGIETAFCGPVQECGGIEVFDSGAEAVEVVREVDVGMAAGLDEGGEGGFGKQIGDLVQELRRESEKRGGAEGGLGVLAG